jgi:single-stranded DNA-binding protein
MHVFENTVTIRGFLARDAETPESGRITAASSAILTLATVSGIWNLGANEWHSRTDWHRVVCPGPYFCGLVRGMRRGDYVEVAGELRIEQQERSIVVAGERFPVRRDGYAIHSLRITRLDRPDALVDLNDTDEGG